MPHNCTDDKSVQVMAWCRQAASHYLNQCWPCSMLPYDVTRPQCIDIIVADDLIMAAPNHYLSLSWTSFILPYGVTQWVNITVADDLATKEARASAATVLSQNILVSPLLPWAPSAILNDGLWVWKQWMYGIIHSQRNFRGKIVVITVSADGLEHLQP